MKSSKTIVSFLTSIAVIALLYFIAGEFGGKTSSRHAPASADKLRSSLAAQSLPPWQMPAGLNPKEVALGQKLFLTRIFPEMVKFLAPHVTTQKNHSPMAKSMP